MAPSHRMRVKGPVSNRKVRDNNCLTMPEVKKSSATEEMRKKSKAKLTGAAREAHREELLGRLPRSLKEKYEAGCSRCRWRALCTASCWKRRGWQ